MGLVIPAGNVVKVVGELMRDYSVNVLVVVACRDVDSRVALVDLRTIDGEVAPLTWVRAVNHVYRRDTVLASELAD